LGQLVELFAPTAEVIMTLEGEKYVTLSLVLVTVCYLEVTTTETKMKCMFTFYICISIHICKSYFLDPEADHKQLHVVIKDMEEELKIFWDKLPIDTVIASVLDPRTKKYHKIPPHEINEAVKIIKSV
jgi:hypothetical protein